LSKLRTSSEIISYYADSESAKVKVAQSIAQERLSDTAAIEPYKAPYTGALVSLASTAKDVVKVGYINNGFEVLDGPEKKSQDAIKVPCRCLTCGDTVYQRRYSLYTGTKLTKCLTCVNNKQKAEKAEHLASGALAAKSTSTS
jgi:hypothetical protein